MLLLVVVVLKKKIDLKERGCLLCVCVCACGGKWRRNKYIVSNKRRRTDRSTDNLSLCRTPTYTHTPTGSE